VAIEPRSVGLDLLTSTVCDALIVEGMEDARSIREIVARRPDAPVLVVASSGDQTAALIREGADDVLVRDEVTASTLARALAHAVARHHSESTFRALAEGSAAAFFIYQDSKLRYVNPTLEALLGYKADELIGRDPLELIHPDHHAGLATRREGRPRAAGVEDRREVRVRTRSGDERWVDLTTAPIVYLGRAAVVGTAIDITDRKALEQRVMASQRLEAVGRLAGGIAHDFNNLLLVISGQTERLLEGLGRGHPLRGAAAAIQGAAQRAAALTHQLLAFGRRQMLIPSPIDLNTVVGDMEALLRHSVGKDVAVVTELTYNLPRVRADRAQIEQVLVNLAANARDAMPEGGQLTLTTDVFAVTDELRRSRPWLTDGNFVRLQVTDTGVGVSPDALPHLFEPFFTTKPGGPGSGLGLATVYGVVKQSGGFIWVDSHPGQGTRVTLLLPAVEATVQEPMTTRPAPRENAVVLLVEDEEAVRELLTSALERAGFEVHAATSGEEALELERQRRFDLLVTDVVLPKITGPQLAREIRHRSPETRVLFMSGYAGDSLDAAESGGPRTFIQKPFSSRALVDRVRELLNQPQPR
jgi:hypothetical protein